MLFTSRNSVASRSRLLIKVDPYSSLSFPCSQVEDCAMNRFRSFWETDRIFALDCYPTSLCFSRSNSAASWQERREDIRRRRAALRRQSLGLSVAPYNTTQFLMEEHQGEVDEEDLVHPRRKRGDSFNSVSHRDFSNSLCLGNL